MRSKVKTAAVKFVGDELIVGEPISSTLSFTREALQDLFKLSGSIVDVYYDPTRETIDFHIVGQSEVDYDYLNELMKL